MKFLSPTDGFHIKDNGNSILKIQSESTSNSHHAKLELIHMRPSGDAHSTTSLYLDTYTTYLSADEAFALQTNGSTRLYVHGSGNVGINTASPSSTLHVNGVITSSGGNSGNWNTAYGWGNHASAGYASASSLSSKADTSHKYHRFNNGEEYYDTYGQENYLRMFTETATFDTFRFRSYSNVEVYNGTEWVASSMSLDNVLDGREDTGINLTHENSHFRFTINRSSGWPTTALFIMQSSWTNTNNYTCTVTLETLNGETWEQKDTWTYSNFQRGINLHTTNQTHDGRGTMRVTINMNWDDVSHNYHALRRIMFLSNFSGGQTLDPWRWSYNKVVNFDALPQAAGANLATQSWVTSQGYLTSETDSQTLSWNGSNGQLTISNGNTVDLDGRYLQSVPFPVSGDWWNDGFVKVGTDGVMEVGKYIDFHDTDAGTSDFSYRITNTGDELRFNGDVRIDDYLSVNGTNASAAPLHVAGANRGNWNDGIVVDDPTGWAATVYKRSNNPKMFTGLRSGTDNFIWMSPIYSNAGTTITAPRTDAILEANSANDRLEIYVPTMFGQNVGINTTNPVQPLQVDGNIYSNGGSFYVNNGDGIQAVGDLTFTTYDSAYIERMRIKANGNIGIGTGAPAAKLDIVGNQRIVHSSGTHGLQIYTNSAIPTTEQFKVGRDSGQYYGILVDDGTARLIHRQDESGSGTHNITSEIWTGSSGGTWTWRVRDNAGVFTRDEMSLSNDGLTVYGSINVENASTNLSQANSAGVLKITTSHGWTNIGPANSSWSHFDTDRAQFYFAKPTEFNGAVKPYTNNSFSLGSTSKQWNKIYGRYIYQDGVQVLSTRAQVHTALYSTGGNADAYTEFGIYRNYAENGPINGHNTILNVAQTNGTYGFQLGANTTADADGLYYRSKDTTFGGGAWHQVASRSWVQGRGYLTAVPSGYATETYVNTAVSNLVASAPAALDTLNELAEALGDDPNFSTTVTNSIATKLPLAGGTLTGDLTIGTEPSAGLPNPYGDFAQLIFDNSHNSSANGPNKIVMHDNGSHWKGGFGIHSGTVAYYSGQYHRWYKTSADSYDQKMSLDDNGNLVITGTLSASGYNKSNWDTAYGWGDHSTAGYMTPIYNGANDNSGKADFAVGVGGSDGAAISFLGSQFQVGAQDINYTFRLDSSGNQARIKSWERDIIISNDGSASSTGTKNIRFFTKPSGAATTERMRIDGEGYTYFHGLDLAISNVNSSHGAGNFIRGNSTHLVIGTSGTLHLNNEGSTTVIHGSNIYPATNGVANLGTTSAYFNRMFTNSIQGGGYTQINDYTGGSTWFIRSNGRFVFGNGHDWTQSFELSMAQNGVPNGTYAELGQRTSNEENGRYKGVRIVKRENSGTVNGDLKAGKIEVESITNGVGAQIEFNDNIGGAQRVYLTGYHADGSSHGGGASLHLTSTEPNVTMVSERYHSIQHGDSSQWAAAYSWGNHASAGYLTSVPSEYLTQTEGDARYLQSLPSHSHTFASITNKTAFVDNGMLSGRSTNATDTVGDGKGVSFNYLLDNQTSPDGVDHALMTMSYSNAWQTQLAQDWRENGRMYIRGQENGTWSSWGQVWSSHDFSPSSFASSSHTHAASAITSGTFAAARIPSLAASKITSGTFAAARIPNLSASKITSGTFADARIASASNWNTAYGWGNHASAGYLTGGSDIGVRNITARNISPEADRTYALGTDSSRWQIVFCETLDSAGQHESNLQDEEQPISQYATGTVLSWKDGKNRPCTQFADHMRMGIAVHGQDSPLIQGAEPVLCTGIVEEGDYLVTSRKEGHAEAMPRHMVVQQQLLDCVIGKALENGDGESHLIKTWINI